MALLNRTDRLRLRRLFRRRRRQIESAAHEVEEQFDSNLIGRFDRLVRVRRFVAAWIILLVVVTIATVAQILVLSKYYQSVKPVPGGTFNEGIVGSYSNANPLYATGTVDTAVSRLIFAGLLKYDDHNRLVGDLAKSYKVDDTGERYTVTLKPHLTWQDGQPLTAADVVFTYHLIQNPDARSPLITAWQGITISAPNNHTVQFDLPNVLSSFPQSLITGIIPKHILQRVPAGQMRANPFNTVRPIGAGPFAFQTFQASSNTDPDKITSSVALTPFANYSGGQPKLNAFVVRTYPSEDTMITAFQNRELTAMAGLHAVPSNLKDRKSSIYNMPSTAALMTFFKTSSGVLSDVQVRQALVQGSDVPAIIKKLSYPAKPVREPLLLGQLGYNPKYQQANYDPDAAKATLNKAGWVMGHNGMRSKNGQSLGFRLYAEDTPENRMVVNSLIKNWRDIGVDASSVLQPVSDFQTTLEFHTYDALLYGISIGTDPDVFAYWDSSQADIRASQRFNFSEYSSKTADEALESGRTRTDPALRVIKYRPFLQAWQKDAPALGLYQPRFLYISHVPIAGLTEHTLNADADRYASVANWEINTARVTNN